MAQLTVRHLEEDIKTDLKRRASAHGWSMEEEVRQILRNAVKTVEKPSEGLGSIISKKFSKVGLLQDLPKLSAPIRAARFEP
jgi:antitoxin FitA